MTIAANDLTVRIHHTPIPSNRKSNAAKHTDSLPVYQGFRYQLKSLIAEGGMGKVYRAFDSILNREVALKIHLDSSMEMDSRIRFSEEAIITGQLQHPGIPPIYDLGILPDGQSFLAMKVIEGQTLEALVQSDWKGMNIANLFESICQAIGFAHVNRIIHRDLKPSNIMIGEFGEVQVMDWGLAKPIDQPGQRLSDTPMPPRFTRNPHQQQTQVGTILGTPAYMSPEQASGQSALADERSDVFGLGGILCFMLTGQPPFPDVDFETMTMSTLKSDLDSTYLRLDHSQGDPELISLAKRCLSFDPKERPANGNVVAHLVKDIQDQATERAKATLLAKIASDAKRKIWVGSFAVVCAVLLIGTTVSLWQAVVATNAQNETAIHLKNAKDSESKMVRAGGDSKLVLRAMLEVLASFDPHTTKVEAETIPSVLAKRMIKAGKQLTPDSIHDQEMLSQLQDQIGKTLLSLGYFKEAIDFLKVSWEIKSKLLGPQHVSTLMELGEMATAYEKLGEVNKAVPILEQTLEGIQSQLGPDHPDTVVCMNRLAIGYLGIGQLDRAIPLFEKTLEVKMKKTGLMNHDALSIANNLAEAYKVSGQLEKSINLFEQSLAAEKSFQTTHPPRLIATMNNLALAYQVNRQYDLAQPIFDAALPIAKTNLGPEHPTTIAILGNIAENLKMTGRAYQSIPLHVQVLEYRIKKHGETSPQALISMNNLATVYRVIGEYQKGLPYLQKAYDTFTKSFGKDHPIAMAFEFNLAIHHRCKGDIFEALPFAEDVYQRRMNKLGPVSQETTMTLEFLTQLYQELMEVQKIEPLLDRYVASSRAKVPSDDANGMKILTTAGELYLQAGCFTKAESLLQECADRFRQRKLENWESQHALSLLGGAKLRQGKFTEAEPLLTQSFESLLKTQSSIPAKSKNVVFEASQRLVELYRQTNRPDLARAVLQRAPREQIPIPLYSKE
ncbi:MAG: serine/threonine-protein kinase [Gemmataceae bacterium]